MMTDTFEIDAICFSVFGFYYISHLNCIKKKGKSDPICIKIECFERIKLNSMNYHFQINNAIFFSRPTKIIPDRIKKFLQK